MSDGVLTVLGYAALAMGGLVLLVALFRDRARGRKRCPKCWYDMSAGDTLVCPECGRDAKRERRLRRTRRHKRWAMLGVLAAIGGGALLVTPKVRRDGIWSVMPTTMVILAMTWADDDAALIELGERMGWRDGRFAEHQLSAAQWELLVPRCVELMDHERPRVVRVRAAGILRRFPFHEREAPEGFVDALVAAMDPDDSDVGRPPLGTVWHGYELQPRTRRELAEALAVWVSAHPDARMCDEVVEALLVLQPEVRAILAPAVVGRLDAVDAGSRIAAAKVLGRWALADETIVDGLVEMAGHHYAGVRVAALTALGEIVSIHEGTLDWLDENRYPQYPWYPPAGDLGLVRGRIVDAFARGLRDRDAAVRAAAAKGVTSFRDCPEPHARRIVALAAAPDVHPDVIRSIGRLGDVGREATDRLLMHAWGGNDARIGAAVDALGRLGTPPDRFGSVLRELLPTADFSRYEMSKDALVAMTRYPSLHDELIPHLLGLLEGVNWEALVAARALRLIGAPAAPHVPALVEHIAREDREHVRHSLIEAIWEITHDTGLVLGLVQEEWAGGDHLYQFTALLADIGPEAHAMLPTLRRWLAYESNWAWRNRIRAPIDAISAGEGAPDE